MAVAIARIDAMLLPGRTKNAGKRQWGSGLGGHKQGERKSPPVRWMVIAKVRERIFSSLQEDVKRRLLPFVSLLFLSKNFSFLFI